MEVLRDGHCEEMLALCGGCCTCSTCHVWVEGGFFEALPAMSEQEADLLALAGHRRDNSRLSCQIRLSDALDGIRVTMPPQD
jgi:2Fe-2S ferredoxin